MIVILLIIVNDFLLDTFGCNIECDMNISILRRGACQDTELKCVESPSGVACGSGSQEIGSSLI